MMAKKKKKKKPEKVNPKQNEDQEKWDFSKEADHTNMELRTIKGTPYPEEFPRGSLKKSYKTAIQKALDKGYSAASKLKAEIFNCLVTPKLARILFLHRAPNRKPSKSAVARYTAELLEERWTLTGQPIILDMDDRVIDGQQRLMAIIESGQSAEIVFVRGVPHACFEFMDTGMNRSSKHMLECFRTEDGNRVERPQDLASALNLAVRYCRAIENQSASMNRQKIDARLPLNAFKAYPKFATMSDWYKESKKELSSLGLTAGTSILSMFFTHEKNEGMAEEFWEGLSTGVSLNKTSPILALRNFLISEIASPKEKPKSSFEWALEATVVSWNMFVNDQKCRKKIKIDEEKEEFPQFEGSSKIVRGILRSIGE